MPDAFEEYEGNDVVDATISVMKAGDGLSTALQVDPIPYHRGDRVYVVLETVCEAVTYEESKRFPSLLARKHKLVTQHGTIVGQKQVAKLLTDSKKEQAEHAAREKERIEAEKGTLKIDGTDLDNVTPIDGDHASKTSD